ncbi:lipopolysaccharide/colanic/teichoic acid biosynthesis glycosyltransferase [Rhizomicrobium palustre]|uniref:Lipopolysaccharide/colanic/teichoic acid biosynthesis glycosyltransferase n=1 Tax=Rhizomicrobium palustre TaxID=189966 RepID=A0A846MUH6_9PROT|nr:sugar transferase [Rhizomicrobium palustre]NIK86730.1 lipopolysaccharide/colanic/teichoic acid biosynthesis glycosyltransferase [Rhizomicrobium palustre]
MRMSRMGDIAAALALLLLCLPALVIVFIMFAPLPLEIREEILPDGRRLRFFALRVRRNSPWAQRCGTFLCRFHVDRVPMLFNVLKGELSLLPPMIRREH